MMMEELKNYLTTEIAPDRDRMTLGPDDDLLELGSVDSMAVMKLVAFLEKNFGIEVRDEDIVPENFQSLARMATYVEQRRAGK